MRKYFRIKLKNMIGRSNIKKYANGKDIHCGVELTINHTDAGGVELLVSEEAYKRFEVAFLFGIAYFIEYLELYKKYKIENIKITINYVAGHAPFWNSEIGRAHV